MTNQVEAWEKIVTEQGLRLAELKTDMTLPSSPSPPKPSEMSLTLAASGFSFPWQESITMLSGRPDEDHGEDEIGIQLPQF
ncbi:hypothetical protein LR48_Vigan09g107200 [Vigna angularis]|uniref:Uncharacterized protein n=1 Tax=Phaseolus angularis TaxID=3914 RepID=A0A0L9VBL8_PHAAN|nr:hypothetical protein LR48_Vigan09g107200 [Vigna angularis]